MHLLPAYIFMLLHYSMV